jgi:Ulp1 family protease
MFFFLDRLLDRGVYTYSNIKRWSKKFDVFEQDKVCSMYDYMII